MWGQLSGIDSSLCLWSQCLVLFSMQMPLLSSKFLQKHRELRLAHLALSAMTMGYVWQEGENGTIEVPLCDLFVISSLPFLSALPINMYYIWTIFHLPSY